MNKKSIITILLALVAMAAQAQTIPTDWFKTDTITIRGRIEGYDAGNVRDLVPDTNYSMFRMLSAMLL